MIGNRIIEKLLKEDLEDENTNLVSLSFRNTHTEYQVTNFTSAPAKFSRSGFCSGSPSRIACNDRFHVAMKPRTSVMVDECNSDLFTCSG